jgi:hypothetical protein
VPEPNLGKLISVHGTSQTSLHRAAIVAVVSFAFFLGMLIAFYIRQEIGYFVLSSAFLFLYLFTMVTLLLQKRNTVKIYENGIAYKKFTAAWNEIARVKADTATGILLSKEKGENVTLSPSISGINDIARTIQSNLQH